MNSLRGRLLLSAGAALLVFTIITGFGLQTALVRYTAEAEYERLQGLLFSLLGATEIDYDNGAAQIILSRVPEPRLGQPDSGLNAIIYSDQGNPLWVSPSLLRVPNSVALPPVNEWSYLKKPHFSLAYGFEWVLADDSFGRYGLVVQDLNSPLARQQRRLSGQMWLWLLAFSAALLFTLLAVMHWGLRPLKRVPNELAEIRSGGRKRLSGAMPKELRPLSRSVNALLSHEERMRERFRNALADLAHSLKTPLAVLQNHSQHDALVSDQIRSMENIIGYQLKRAATAGSKPMQEPVKILPIVKRLQSVLEKVYADKKPQFDLQISDEFGLPIDQDDLMELLGNLLENAAKYGQGRVRVSQVQDAVAAILIEDDGPGFPLDAEKLLQRGMRADERASGQGIGLAVVSDIMNSYGATLSLRRSDLGGASVRLEFGARLMADDVVET